eukprot:scaffold5108_cov172-Amphora_coffeaeformis.AAC.3
MINSPTSILIIGNPGLVGLERLRQLPFQRSKAKVHLLYHNPNVIPEGIQMFCDAIMVGDEQSAKDIERALRVSNATLVVLTMADIKITLSRDPTRMALARVLQKPGFGRTEVLAVSRTGTAVISYERQKLASSQGVDAASKKPKNHRDGHGSNMPPTTKSSHSSLPKKNLMEDFHRMSTHQHGGIKLSSEAVNPRQSLRSAGSRLASF